MQENCYKLHACCGHTHSAIDLTIALRNGAGLSARDAAERVASIDIETYGPGFEIVKESRPRTPYQAKFSMAYCAAVAMLEGRAGLEQFAADRFTAGGVSPPALASLVGRTHVRVADDLTLKYPAAWPARVSVALTDGSRLTGSSDYPRGNPENPVDRRELEDKFTALVSPPFGTASAARALATIARLRSADDMAGVFSSLIAQPHLV